jgi:ligand-binding sensor domain-containing protein
LTALSDARACVPLAQDRLAVATGGGLAIVARGDDVQVLTSLDGLPDTRVLSLAPSADGLWVGTEAGVAFVALGPRTARVVRTSGRAPVSAVHIGRNGDVYLGTRGLGLQQLKQGQANALAIPNTSSGTRVASIAEMGDELYVAFADGPLARLDGGTVRALAGSPTHGHALAVWEGSLMLGDLEGLFRVDGGRFLPIGRFDVRGLAASERGLLVATYGSGLLLFRSHAGAPVGGGLFPPSLSPEGDLPSLARGVAVAGGVRCVATPEGVFASRPEGPGDPLGGPGALRRVPLGVLSSNDITALDASAQGRVVLGTFEDGAFFVDDATPRRLPAIDPHEGVNALAWEGERLWAGTVHGLLRVDPSGAVRRFGSAEGLPSSLVRAVRVLSADRILVGTERGAAIVSGDRATPVAPVGKRDRSDLASPMHATWALGAAADGTLYLGTTVGLYYGKEGRFRRLSVAGGDLPDDWVTALAVDGVDVYAGTYAKGVVHLRLREGRVSTAPLGGGYVNPGGLLLAGGTLYAATMDGLLSRPRRDDAAAWAIAPEAAPGRDVTAVLVVGTEKWVTSRRGVGVSPAE